ncbi:magnesium transporter CorA family protein [Exiguobacterium flavidum]|uniref:magnesium transporter CorA family protein n=1 Tax=Exiguobacterium flavidum TaxID=2184695 RepID=UPI000DF826DE|nr:magnesium transporter CorA family protein [Exiguobacterium flavidum]
MDMETRFTWRRYANINEFDQSLYENKDQDNAKFHWFNLIRKRQTNYTYSGLNTLYGSLITWQNPANKGDRVVIYYYLTRSELITIGFPEHVTSLVSQFSPTTPFAAFYAILALQMNTYFEGIDDFEADLLAKQEELRGRISERSLDSIFALRSTIENWSDIIIPFQELIFAGQESFISEEDYPESDSFRLAKHRVRRLLMLIEHYQKDIEVLLDLATTVSNFRGNEIMKALTIFTAVATPMMALGAIWGMNFKNMPELDWKYGYAASLSVIFLSTAAIFWWMKTKGWLGSLVRMPKEKKHKN